MKHRLVVITLITRPWLSKKWSIKFINRKKIIAFSLYGNVPKYNFGAIRNARLAQTIYPGWESWFYCSEDTNENTRSRLSDLGARVICLGLSKGHCGAFWRFRPLADETVDIWLSRDCDSSLSERERSAVDQWLSSGKTLHIMRDSIYHTEPILAGMFGVNNCLLRERYKVSFFQLALEQLESRYTDYGEDQHFLRETFWKLLEQDYSAHDHYRHFKTDRELEFPVRSISSDILFVGQQFDEWDQPEAFPQTITELKARQVLSPYAALIYQILLRLSELIRIDRRTRNVFFSKFLNRHLTFEK